MGSRILSSADIAAAGGVLSADVGTITAVISASENQTELAAIATDAANDAAAAAITATGAANTATGTANTATTASNTATAAANTATAAANTATAAANTATGLANTATSAANTATGLATAATAATTTAISASQNQTELANTATTAANIAASTATSSASTADLITAAAEAFLDNVSGQEILTITGTKVLSASDNGKLIAFNGAGQGLLYADTGLPTSFQVEVMKAGTGNVFILAGPNATVAGIYDATSVTTRYASAWLRQIADGSLVLTDGDSSTAPTSVNRPIFNTSLASGLALAWFI